MSKKEFTQEQIDFIKANRLKMTINKMCAETGIGYTRMHHYMNKNNLLLTKEEKKQRSKICPKHKNKIGEWVADPWNRKLNLITLMPG